MKHFFCLLVIAIMLISCDPVDARPTVKNNSDYAISFEIMHDTIFSEVHYPGFHIYGKILPGEKGRRLIIGSPNRAWSHFIRRSVNNKLNVFIFSTDTLKKYGCFEPIIERRLYTRYSFTEEELDEMGWVIEYPQPSPAGADLQSVPTLNRTIILTKIE